MKHFLRTYWVWAFMFFLAAVLLMGCAKHAKPTQPEEQSTPPAATKEEPAKPEAEPAAEPPQKESPQASEPSKKEAPPAPEPAKKEPLPAHPSPPTRTTAPSPAPVTKETKEPAQHTTEVALPFVNLREGPSMNQKIIRVVKEKMKLDVLEEKLGWLRVRLEDGVEGWIAKSMTTEGKK